MCCYALWILVFAVDYFSLVSGFVIPGKQGELSYLITFFLRFRILLWDYEFCVTRVCEDFESVTAAFIEDSRVIAVSFTEHSFFCYYMDGSVGKKKETG